jgi:cyclic pyranopterin phosphate synthase
MTKKLSHVDRRGRVVMVDVGAKPVSDREAVARGSIAISREALRQIRQGTMKKGDPLQTATRSRSRASRST